ncbi:MAG: SMI1/KNR4 family protein [Parvularculaceae bacterium]
MPFPVDEKYLVACEAHIGRSLPTELRARLSKNNGGEIEVDGEPWRLFPVWDDSERDRIKRTANHIVTETTAAHAGWGMSGDLVTIGEDGCGNYLVLKPYGEEVFVWGHETQELSVAKISWTVLS